ncbi:MAG: dTDP-4-dehydrorhamnose 3,5-epimerase [Hyphomonadaceae bacterium]
MKITRLAIPDVLLIEPARHGDHRGFFSETFKASVFAEAVPGVVFVQDNHSLSAAAGVLRGLHFQAPPRAQGKLVRVTAGAIFDVALDIRRGSPTYGAHVSAVLSAENWAQLWVPPGFAHAFQTTAPDTQVLYKTTDEYDPPSEGGVAYDDPDLRIAWPIAPAVLSERDKGWPRLAAFATPFA